MPRMEDKIARPSDVSNLPELRAKINGLTPADAKLDFKNHTAYG